MSVIYVKEGTLLPKRRELDEYRTPPWAIDAALSLVSPPAFGGHFAVLDVGAGDGRWGLAAKARWPHCHLSGSEVRDVAKPEGFDAWHTGDYLSWSKAAGRRFSVIIGNPPYAGVDRFLTEGLRTLVSGGQLVFLLRLAFLEGQERARGLFKATPPKVVGVYSKRVGFEGCGTSPAVAMAGYLWQKGWRGRPEVEWLG